MTIRKACCFVVFSSAVILFLACWTGLTPKILVLFNSFIFYSFFSIYLVFRCDFVYALQRTVKSRFIVLSEKKCPERIAKTKARSQGISQFYVHTPRSSANETNHACLLLPSRSWSSFIGGMEGWVIAWTPSPDTLCSSQKKWKCVLTSLRFRICFWRHEA